MAGDKYIKNNAGQLQEVAALQASAGAGDAGKIPALDASGRIDNSMMPVGIGADTKDIVTSEALSAGDFVNIYDNAGTPTARKADASSPAKRAHGFVLAAVGSGANATVYFEGQNTQVSGLTAGEVYLDDASPGDATDTAPSTAGHIVQRLGVALDATTIDFDPGPPITLA